jgi:hypothetical protein
VYPRGLCQPPDQVLVFRYTAEKDGKPAPALSGKLRLKPGQPDVQLVAEAIGLSWDAVMPNELKHACCVRVLHTGGSVTADGDVLVFAGCDSLTLLLRTDYAPNYQATGVVRRRPVVAKDIAAASQVARDIASAPQRPRCLAASADVARCRCSRCRPTSGGGLCPGEDPIWSRRCSNTGGNATVARVRRFACKSAALWNDNK